MTERVQHVAAMTTDCAVKFPLLVSSQAELTSITFSDDLKIFQPYIMLQIQYACNGCGLLGSLITVLRHLVLEHNVGNPDVFNDQFWEKNLFCNTSAESLYSSVVTETVTCEQLINPATIPSDCEDVLANHKMEDKMTLDSDVNCTWIMEENPAVESDTSISAALSDLITEPNDTVEFLQNDSLITSSTCVFCKKILASPRECLTHYEENHSETAIHIQHRFQGSDNKLDKVEKHAKTIQSSDSTLVEKQRAEEQIEKIFLFSDKDLDRENNSELYKCPLCALSLPKQNLDAHINIKHYWAQMKQNEKKSKEASCHICGAVLKYKRNLPAHIKNMHGSKRRRYARGLTPLMKVCEFCGYQTPETRRLEWHIMSKHKGVMPFCCDYCDYKTSDRTMLRDHKYRHLEEKKYKCHHCNYQCIQRKQLRNHLKKYHEEDLPKKGYNKKVSVESSGFGRSTMGETSVVDIRMTSSSKDQLS